MQLIAALDYALALALDDCDDVEMHNTVSTGQVIDESQRYR